PADDIAKQLIVMLGTLVTAVASFYFGSASVASATAALAQKPGGPLAASISPHPVTASGDPQALMIIGSNLGDVTKLHLEKKGEPDINASSVKAADKSLTAQITIPKGETGSWD